MKKTFLFLSLLFSLCVNAANVDNLTSALKIRPHSKASILSQSKSSLSIFYGGQDISHPLIAIAHEPTWRSEKHYLG